MIKCLNHGYVALVDTMGDDRTPAQTARTSFLNKKERTAEEDAKLTRFLVKHHHNTPLEFCQVRFYMKMPIFVARQLVRHRTSSINELSLRYVKATREFYVPEPERCNKQSENNKQGSSQEIVANPTRTRDRIWRIGEACFDEYEILINEEGLCKELARSVLPLGTYTEWFWQNDLHNTLGMLKKRLPGPDNNPQYEITVYARAMLDLLQPIYPTIIDAWRSADA